ETQASLREGRTYEPMGRELHGAQLLLIGFGASAQALAARALPFGISIMAVDVRDITDAERHKFNLSEAGKPHDLDRLLPACDFVSLHLHRNSGTRHILDARRLG